MVGKEVWTASDDGAALGTSLFEPVKFWLGAALGLSLSAS